MGRTGVAVIFAMSGVVRLCSSVIDARAPITVSLPLHTLGPGTVGMATCCTSHGSPCYVLSRCRVSATCRLRLRKSRKYCNIARTVDLYP
jgi:hypothetical protein